MRNNIVIAAALAVSLALAGLCFLLDMTGPTISVSRRPGPISAKATVLLTLRDAGTGLRSLNVVALQGERTIPILSRVFPDGIREARESFTLDQATGLQEGAFQLQVRANDRARLHFGGGNGTLYAARFDFRNKPPAVAVLSTAHNIYRGGAGLVVYTVTGEVERSGVVVGDRFFPGYRQSGDIYACLFPFPYDLPPGRFTPKVLAVDRAGNERVAGIYYRPLPKSFPRDRIELKAAFLEKVSSEFKDRFPRAGSPLEIFLKANRALRLHDLHLLSQIGASSASAPLWDGDFLRLPNSAPRGTFGQFRTYLYGGKEVDRQTHLGIDLASLPHSKVLAANRGKVVYADDLGIYGQCIIIDHGLGLQTIYGHLSRIGAKVGDLVQKGACIGNTGDSGLAGGDHLHYGVAISGEQVNPIEWWDPSWIKNNVSDKLEAAGLTAPGPRP